MGTGISLCMIVKNEADLLVQAVESVRPIIDEIIIVDTGSQDDTPEIARSLGANVLHRPWQDDFSAARNSSIATATGDWILILDADETITEVDHEKILNYTHQSHVWGYQFVQRTYTREQAAYSHWVLNSGDYPEMSEYPGWVKSTICRLFRNRRGIQFVGQVHELVEMSIQSLGGTIIVTDTPIHHLGKVIGRESLKAKIKSFPGQYKPLYEYGEACLEAGDHREAAWAFRSALKIRPGKCLLELAMAADGLGETEEAVSLYQEILKRNPDNYDALVNYGYLQARRGYKSNAKESYRRAIKIGSGNPTASINLASLLFDEGDYEGAVPLMERAVKILPGNVRLQHRLGFIYLELGRFDEALGTLRRAYRQSPAALAAIAEESSGFTSLLKERFPTVADELFPDIKPENLKALISSHPMEVLFLAIHGRGPGVEVELSRNNLPVLRIVLESGESILLASRYDPIKESHRWVESVSQDWQGGPTIILGFGFGYHIEALLSESLSFPLWVVESSPSLFRAALQHRDLSAILQLDELNLIIEPSARAAAAMLKRAVGSEKPRILNHSPSIRINRVFHGVVERYFNDEPT